LANQIKTRASDSRAHRITETREGIRAFLLSKGMKERGRTGQTIQNIDKNTLVNSATSINSRRLGFVYQYKLLKKIQNFQIIRKKRICNNK
jgi:hypothetical protein